jgi:hypothetical protein
VSGSITNNSTQGSVVPPQKSSLITGSGVEFTAGSGMKLIP